MTRLKDTRSWLALALLLASGALAVTLGSLAQPCAPWLHALDWQLGYILREPWRLWSAAWVHWSMAHLAANLGGVALIGAIGARARIDAHGAWAWALSWPLTQALLVLPPAQAMQHYGGLSGVLHAGVIVLGLTLALSPKTDHAWPSITRLTPGQAARQRWIGIGLLAGTLAKVLLEAPWSHALRPNTLLGIQVAPWAHACGIAAGVIAWFTLMALHARPSCPA